MFIAMYIYMHRAGKAAYIMCNFLQEHLTLFAVEVNIQVDGIKNKTKTCTITFDYANIISVIKTMLLLFYCGSIISKSINPVLLSLYTVCNSSMAIYCDPLHSPVFITIISVLIINLYLSWDMQKNEQSSVILPLR